MNPVLMVEAEFPWDTIDTDQITGLLLERKLNATEIPSDDPATLQTGGK
jgi:hypothetical protein